MTTELKISSETSDVNTSIDSDCSVNITQQGPSNDKPQLTKDFVKNIAMIAASKNFLSRDLMHVCTDLIVSSGGNFKDLLLSYSTIWRGNKKLIQGKAAQHKRGIKRAAEETFFPIIAHFDRKIVEDITDGKKAKRDRFAVFANINGDLKLLGIPAMEHETGAA